MNVYYGALILYGIVRDKGNGRGNVSETWRMEGRILGRLAEV